jgi:TPR repeat protein
MKSIVATALCSVLMVAILPYGVLQAEPETPSLEALETLVERASGGDADAQYQIAMVLTYKAAALGPDVLTEGIRWFTSAAAQGHADAQYQLGIAYAQGRAGGEPNHERSAEWYRLAAAQGHVDAQSSLGFCYAQGRGVDQDFAAALGLYKMAAERGNYQAQHYLGFMYADGKGTPRNLTLSYMWFRIASAQRATSDRYRDEIGKLLSPEQISNAEVRAREWMARNDD